MPKEVDGESKQRLCLSIIENSELTSEYQKLTIEALMRIPMAALREISVLVDRVIIMRSGDYAGQDVVRFTCMAKHEMRPAAEAIVIKGKTEAVEEPKLTVKPVYHQSHFIILVEDNINKLPKQKRIEVIAHEFAHVFLRHDRFGDDCKEKEVADLLLTWGFKDN